MTGQRMDTSRITPPCDITHQLEQMIFLHEYRNDDDSDAHCTLTINASAADTTNLLNRSQSDRQNNYRHDDAIDEHDEKICSRGESYSPRYRRRFTRTLPSILLILVSIISLGHRIRADDANANANDDAYGVVYDDEYNADLGFDGVSVMPVSCLNYNNGHMIKFELFENNSNYQCHFKNLGVFVVSIAHYMRAYFNYEALVTGNEFYLPSDAGYLNCVMLRQTAYSDFKLYAKIGCMDRETFTSTKLQLHVYTDNLCSYPYDDGNSDRYHSTKGYNINGYLFSTKVSFRPPFYSCLSCKPDQISDTFNKKHYWYDDDYINSQGGNKQRDDDDADDADDAGDDADDAGGDDAAGDDAGGGDDDKDDYFADDYYNDDAGDDGLNDDMYFAANDDAGDDANDAYDNYNKYNQNDDAYDDAGDDAADDAGDDADDAADDAGDDADDAGGDDADDAGDDGGDDAGDDGGDDADDGGDDAGDDGGNQNKQVNDDDYYNYVGDDHDDYYNRRRLLAPIRRLEAAAGQLEAYHSAFTEEINEIRRSLGDPYEWNMCDRLFKYGMWCDEECRALDTFRVDEWSHSDIFLLIIMCVFMAAMMLLVFAKRVKAYEKASVYGDELDASYPGLPPMVMILVFGLIMTIIMVMANLKFVNETLVFSVVTCILLFIYMLKLTLFENKGPHLLSSHRNNMALNSMNRQLFD